MFFYEERNDAAAKSYHEKIKLKDQVIAQLEDERAELDKELEQHFGK